MHTCTAVSCNLILESQPKCHMCIKLIPPTNALTVYISSSMLCQKEVSQPNKVIAETMIPIERASIQDRYLYGPQCQLGLLGVYS